jgi:hypothetical protein
VQREKRQQVLSAVAEGVWCNCRDRGGGAHDKTMTVLPPRFRRSIPLWPKSCMLYSTCCDYHEPFINAVCSSFLVSAQMAAFGKGVLFCTDQRAAIPYVLHVLACSKNKFVNVPGACVQTKRLVWSLVFCPCQLWLHCSWVRSRVGKRDGAVLIHLDPGIRVWRARTDVSFFYFILFGFRLICARLGRIGAVGAIALL